MLNICLCVDLVLSLINPFFPSQRRMKPYLASSFIATSILIGIIESQKDRTCRNTSRIEKLFLNSSLANVVFALLLSIYIIIALYSCVYAMRRLTRPGVSKEVRKNFVINHFLYVVTFIIVWTVFLASAYYHLFNIQLQDKKN